MKYSLDWATDALSSLAALWIAAPDRKAVTAAQATMDVCWPKIRTAMALL